MSFKNIKLELFYLRRAFLMYKKGFKYLYNKYFLAQEILKVNKILEKPVNNHDLSVHILSCHRDLVMLIWSLASFYRAMDTIGELYIHSDGSITSHDKFILHKFFPNAQVIEPDYFLKKYNYQLAQYPIIKKFRTEYPEYFLLQKLIDPYFISNKPHHLIIDSDLIWFKKLDEIEQGIKTQKSLMMQGRVGKQSNFVYFKNNQQLDKRLANFNSGIVLYSKENFDLEKLIEYFEKIDINQKENKHFIEQAGYAYCLKDLHGLPQEKYIIKAAVDDHTVVRHYTAPRRAKFYIEGIPLLKKILNI